MEIGRLVFRAFSRKNRIRGVIIFFSVVTAIFSILEALGLIDVFPPALPDPTKQDQELIDEESTYKTSSFYDTYSTYRLDFSLFN